MSVPNTQLLRKLIIMRMKKLMMALLCLSFSGALSAQITNPSFESGFDGWRESDPNQVITISNIANSGNRSARIRSNGGRVSQRVNVETNSTYRLTAQLRGAGRLNAQVGNQRTTERVNNGSEFAPLSIEFDTGSSDEVEIFMEFSGSEGRWDDLELVRISGGEDFGLNPNLDPWDNFDLSVWGLDSPALREISANDERGVRIDEFEFIALNEGANNPDFDDAERLFFGRDNDVESSEPYFFTAPDGGMVFKSPVDGGRTSTNARFPRSELREYVRGGVTNRQGSNGGNESISVSGLNENNWVLGYQPQNLILDDNNRSENIQNVGGRNGRLEATLRVNKVTETGRPDDIGVTIIGQIHAESDEPLRLYYRKLPQNELGSVYFLHEIRGDMDGENTGRDGDDLDEIVLVGSRADNAPNPIGGIALNELFSYEIVNNGSIIEVVLRRGDSNGQIIARRSIDMATVVNDGITGSGYDRRNEWMYFKAGVYTQNNAAVENGQPGAATTGFGISGTEADYDQATFYRLSVSHDENDCDQCTSID